MSAPDSLQPALSTLRRGLRHLPALLGLVLLAAAIYVVRREFSHLNLADVGRALDNVPRAAVIEAFAWTIAAYGVLTLYDLLATIYAGRWIGYPRTAFASFCAYALAHNLGFAAVSGAAVRYRLYAHWGLTPSQIAKVIAFCSLTFGLGGMSLGGVILFIEPQAVPWFGTHLPRLVMFGLGAVMWVIVGAYVVLASRFPVLHFRGRTIELPGARLAFAQVALAAADVVVTGSIMFCLLPDAPGLTFTRFLAVYLGSYAAGLVASVPGGLGVFDAGILLGLAGYMPAPAVLGAIVIFRLFYYIIPLFLAGAMFAGNEVLVSSGRLARPATAEKPWSETELAAAASTGAVAICGALLLSIGLLDTHPDYSWANPGFAAFAASAGQYVPSLIGTALMVLAVGLSQRVTLAWGATITLLFAGAIVTALQGERAWIPACLVIAALSISPFREAYYRQARLVSQTLRPGTLLPLLALLGSIVWLASFQPKLRLLPHTSWWEVVFSREAPNSLRLALALAVILLLAALWGVLRPGRVVWLPWNAITRARYEACGKTAPADAEGMVIGEGGRCAVAFRRVGNVVLALGDPAGPRTDRASAIWRLRDMAAQEGREVAVWHAGAEMLKTYGELGLTALSLGEDGLPLEGVGGAGAFVLCCDPERDLGELLPVLATIGQRRAGWLRAAKEG
jgi:uncharacterized membrane protein YbhN (UPF0104 family)